MSKNKNRLLMENIIKTTETISKPTPNVTKVNRKQTEVKTSSDVLDTAPSEVTFKKNIDDDTLTLNLQPYLTPLSIIIGSIIISLSIFFSLKGQNLLTPTGTTTGVIVTPTATTTDTTTEQNPAGKTSIGDAPFIGNKESAKVAIVEFSDYECPFCKRHHTDVYPDIVKNYVDTGKVIYVYRNYIAVPGHNPAATTEAYAASCVKELTNNDSNKFFEYGEQLYINTTANGGGLTGTKLYDLAGSMGVNTDQLKTCVESGKYKDLLASDQKFAEEAGIQGTPGFIVGKLSADGTVDGKIIAGAYPITEFDKVIAEMMQ